MTEYLYGVVAGIVLTLVGRDVRMAYRARRMHRRG
jgi:hypothetical protein